MAKGGKDWKSKAQKLKLKVAQLKAELTGGAPAQTVKATKPVSPLAPRPSSLVPRPSPLAPRPSAEARSAKADY